MTSPTATALTYDGTIPIDDTTVQDWVRNGVTRVRVQFLMDLPSIIDAAGMDEFNDLVDDTIGLSLVDLAYGFARPSPGDDLPEDTALLWVEGDLDPSMLTDESGA